MTPSIVVKGMTAAIVTRLGCCFFLRVSAVFHKTTGDVVPRIGESTGAALRRFLHYHENWGQG